jgi:hypothetical protein
MKVQAKLFAKAVPGGSHFDNLAGKADHIIQPGGFQEDALQCFAASQARQAVSFGYPEHHQAVIEG